MASKKRKAASTASLSPASDTQTIGVNDDNRPFLRSVRTDLEVVSSDGYRFHTQKSLLMSSSVVLADLLAIPRETGGPELCFVDDTLETAEVIGAFMRLVHGMDLDPRHSSRLHHLIGFLRKYDAEIPLKSLRHQLRASLAIRMFDEFDVFRALAQLDDGKGCAEAIRRGYGGRFSRRDGETESWEFADTNHNIDGERKFDPAGWGEDLIRTIPSKATIALLRAIRWTGNVDLEVGDEVAARFGQYYTDKGGW